MNGLLFKLIRHHSFIFVGETIYFPVVDMQPLHYCNIYRNTKLCNYNIVKKNPCISNQSHWFCDLLTAKIYRDFIIIIVCVYRVLCMLISFHHCSLHIWKPKDSQTIQSCFVLFGSSILTAISLSDCSLKLLLSL